MNFRKSPINLPSWPAAARIVAIAMTVAGLSSCDPASGNASYETAAPDTSPMLNLGKWQLSEKVDPMTDQKVVRVYQQAEGSDVILSIACSKQNAWVHVLWEDFLGGRRIKNVLSTQGEEFEIKNVTYRVGDSQPITQEMAVLNDRKTTQFGDVVSFIEQVRTSNRLVLQTQPYNENPKTVVFDTTGLTNILTAKRPECDWYVRDILRAEYAEKKRLADEEAKKNPFPPAKPVPHKPMPMPDPDALIK